MLGGVVKDEASAVTMVETRPALRGSIEVDVEIVPDDVDRSGRILRGDRAHEAPQVLGLPRRAAGRDDVSGAHIERREDGLRPVPPVFPFPTRTAAWLAWPPMIGVAMFQGLHAGHLVHAEHGAARRRVEIEVADLGHLLPELRIGAVEPAPHQMRPDGTLREDPLHGRLADRGHDPAGDRLPAHLLDRPRDRDVLGLSAAVRPGVLLPDRLTGQGDDLAARDGVERRGMAPAREIPEAFEPLTQEPPAPAFDAPDRDAHASRDLACAPAFDTGQDDPRPCGIPLRVGRRAHAEGQFCGLLGRQLEDQWRPSPSCRGPHLSESRYRSISEMYSAFSAVMSGPDH